MNNFCIKELFDISQQQFLIVDKNGIACYSNNVVSGITGFNNAQIIGKKPSQLWGGQMKPKFYENLWNKICIQKEIFIGKVQNKNKNNQIYEDNLFIVPILNSNNETVYYIHFGNINFNDKNLLKLFNKTFLLNKTFNKKNINLLLKNLFIKNYKNKEIQEKIDLYDDVALDIFIEKEFIFPTQNLYFHRYEDNTLIELAQKDTNEFYKIYNKYKNQIKFYFIKRVDDNIVEDLTQEVFIQAFKSLNDFKIINALYGTYLIRIAHNILVDYYRLKNSTFQINDNEHFVFDKLDEKIDKTFFWNMLNNYTEFEKNIMILKYKKGYTIKEIAKIYGTTQDTIKSRLKKIKSELKLKTKK